MIYTEMLHHSQSAFYEQARCLFHKKENSLFVEQASCLLLTQDASSTRKFTLCGTGILPVLENGARCEFIPIAHGKRERQQSLE
ncbi:hypothetical protein [Microcoleus sp. B7-D4]|uniref:hypothetical protein n=1 Tax=Microcoleus sp. B7-D4 TaxID=2818696 RepID=UPI002FD2B6FE